MAVDETAQELPQLFHLGREFLDLLRLRSTRCLVQSDRRLVQSDGCRLRLQQRVATLDITGKFARADRHGA